MRENIDQYTLALLIVENALIFLIMVFFFG